MLILCKRLRDCYFELAPKVGVAQLTSIITNRSTNETERSKLEKLFKTKMSFNSVHESLLESDLVGFPRLSNASNASASSTR